MKKCSYPDHQGPRLRPPEDFWRRVRNKDGCYSICRDCGRLESRRRYWQNKEAEQKRNKLYRLRSGYVPSKEARQRDAEAKRQRRLEERRKRANFIVDLVSQEYKIPRHKLLGSGHQHVNSGSKTKPLLHEAMAIAARLIRQFTYLGPEEIAGVLRCTPRCVLTRFRRSEKWTVGQRGDIRIVERIERIKAAYYAVHPKRKR